MRINPTLRVRGLSSLLLAVVLAAMHVPATAARQAPAAPAADQG